MPRDLDIRRQARATIVAERVRMMQLRTGADLHARIWGFLGTLILSVCALTYPSSNAFSRSAADATGARAAGDAAQVMVVAAAAAVAMSFLLSFAQVLVRAAARDTSTRMFSRASRELLVSVAVSIVAAAVLHQAFEVAGAVSIGLTAGLLGPRALGPIKQRAAASLGIKVGADTANQSLGMIDGLTDDVADRLAEEGIDSVHALAFTNTPRIHFATPYTWERICDWQAQAVLLQEMGLARFAKFKEQSPIRSVEDALDLLKEDALVESWAKAIGLGGARDVKPILSALRNSHPLAMLREYARHGDEILSEVVESDEGDPPSSRVSAVGDPQSPIARSATGIRSVAARELNG